MLQIGLFGSGTAEEPPSSSLPKPADDKSTEPPIAFKGQPENDTETQTDISDSPPSSATQVDPAP